ncbi:RHS repeat-associated core domain-containing protein [uncultured Croceitalea sp.]|uniref:RHS repeat protein n=1 Tax=uncultured Croceitalea sp. TaxID=1798908 RepID=UPI00374EF7C5
MEKKLPGKGWEYIVYNKLDQPILTQDANLRTNDQWLFTKYDAFGRVAYTGMINSGSSRSSLQTAADGHSGNLWVGPGSTTIDGKSISYDNGGYPNTGYSGLHMVNYYDNYVDTDGLSVPSTVYGQAKATNVKGLPTVGKVRVLSTDDWITTLTGYDIKRRPIYTASKNNYLNTTDIVEMRLDFTGRPLEARITHTKGSNAAIVTEDSFAYDHQGRLLTHRQSVDGQPQKTLVENSYDQLGQLAQKKTGGGLQQVDYNYNVRGWLKNINNTASLGNDLFAFKVNYNEPEVSGIGVAELFNGNISETLWKTANDGTKRANGYLYDALNRLKVTRFTDNMSSYTGQYNSAYSYDKNGNLSSLVRNTDNGSGSSQQIDALAYSYDSGNKLLSVTDNNGSAEGFNDGNTSGNDYTYDQNGNMTSDANKGITNISYNHLNLPTSVGISGGTISYIYDATGAKQKKTVGSTNTEYAGNYIYENGNLQFFSHPEGYVNAGGPGYDYVYQYKDHLGNIRLSYTDSDGNYEQILSSDFNTGFDGWEENGSVNYSLDNGRLKANVNSSWEGVRRPLAGVTTVAGETLTVKVDFNKGNTQSNVRLYLPEYNSGGTLVRYNVLTSNLQTGYGEYSLTMVDTGNSIGYVRIDKDNTNTGTETYFYVDYVSLSYGNLEIVEENNYYPFGLQHKGYNNVVSANGNSVAQKWKFQGVELEESLGLNLYEMEFRNYDVAIGRFMSIDPLTEERDWLTPYNFVQNNPILRIDPSGLLDVYGLNASTGDIEFIKETTDDFDTLVDSNTNEIISAEVDKGLLSDGLNIKNNGLETKNVTGGLGLAYDISLHTSTEIGGVVYNSGSEKMLNILPYGETTLEKNQNGEVVGMTAGFSFNIAPEWTSSDGSFTGVPHRIIHTHPGHPNAAPNATWLGMPKPSAADLNIADANHFYNGELPMRQGKIESNVFNNVKYGILARKNMTKNGRTSNASVYSIGGKWNLSKSNVNDVLKRN